MSLPSASLLDNARFNALVIVPNALQGIFRRRRAAVAAATKANVDGQAVGLLAGMKEKHNGGPVWVRVIRDPALLLLTTADVRRALAGSPHPFAADPDAKRDGMVAFQPDALTISRGDEWKSRRRFTEHVLQSGGRHDFAERFNTIAREEAASLRTAGPEAGFEAWNDAFRRLTRRVVLGEAAADDGEISVTLAEMMDEANGMPGRTSKRYEDFATALARYVESAEEGSLAERFTGAPQDASTAPIGQIPHWLFANGDTLAINTLRAVGAILSHPEKRARVAEEVTGNVGDAAATDGFGYLEACLEEAMRLWPTTTMLSRVTLEPTDWQGTEVPEGTQLLIPNTFLHRDRSRFDYADRFAPEEWTEGTAGEEWAFNHLSHGPQGCPGAGLTLFLGKAFLAELIAGGALDLASERLDPGEIPHMYDPFGIRLALRGE